MLCKLIKIIISGFGETHKMSIKLLSRPTELLESVVKIVNSL